MRVTIALASMLGLAVAGCSGGDGGGGGGGTPDFGGYPLATLDETCEGEAGVTGQAILDELTTAYTKTLSYVTAQGGTTDPTTLTVGIGWPTTPGATCYPAYEEDGTVLATARVAIEGLTLDFATDDGKFAESMSATAWLSPVQGAFQNPTLIAATTRGSLEGTWEPFPEYEGAGNTLTFVSGLFAANPNVIGGYVSLSGNPTGELEAGVVRSSLAVATW